MSARGENMTLYAAYVRSGREFDVQEECEALDVPAWVPRRVDMIRQGKRRRPDPVVRPYLTGYVFISADPQQWHSLKSSKHIRGTIEITAASEKSVMAFINRVERDYRDRMEQIEAGQRVDEYAPGDLLEIIAGPLAGTLARFASVVGGNAPQIVAETEMMGQTVRVTVDPIAARAAK